MATTVIKINVDGNVSVVDLNQYGMSNLEGMRREIGCSWVDCFGISERVDAWIDDEGMYNSAPNYVATNVAASLAGELLSQLLYGTVLIAGSTPKGDTVSIDDTTLQKVDSIIKTL